jgi:hypothetical protein
MKKFTLSIVFRFTDEKQERYYSCFCNSMKEGFGLFEEKYNNIYRIDDIDKVILHNIVKIERVHFKPFKSVQINSINDRRKVHNLKPLEL